MTGSGDTGIISENIPAEAMRAMGRQTGGDEQWIDISVPLKQGMICWPGDPPFRIERDADMDRGDEATVSRISAGVHSGTHVDAPLHFILSGESIEKIPPAATIGPARVIEIHDPESIKVEELEGHRILAGERILFKTRNSALWRQGRFQEEFVHITPDSARYLAGREVMTVGVDYLSVSGYRRNEAEVHRILLDGNVRIIEGLDLSDVREGCYDLVCLPLRIEGCEAAPARAVLRPRRAS
ncbi:MAG TPA: cyclase family protein [Dissulfurispiraceae bacterium]